MGQAITVSQINRYIKLKLDHDIKLNNVLVSGEISNFKNQFNSGHLYFSLKDENSSVRAVMFRNNAQKVKFSIKDGQKVIVRGDISVYEQAGTYQIYVTDIQPDGSGDLALAFEQLKEKLSNEGLFDASHKKTIPKYPEKVGIVTSKTGAAVQDIINVISRRYPICEPIIYPAVVQGDKAAESIIRGIKYFNLKNDVDVILVGRGGGSIEDLWCFNDENLAREIYSSNIPIISCVGHEIDYTICDFVADLRAPTPSAAAEIAVPDENSVRYVFSDLLNRSEKALERIINIKSEKLNSLKSKNCLISADYYTVSRRERLLKLMSKPCLSNPESAIKDTKLKINDFAYRTEFCAREKHSGSKAKLASLSAKIDALSPLKVLSRGYSVALKNDTIVTSRDIDVGDNISLLFSDGEVSASVISKKEKE